jgi:hypothetical protein
MNEGLIFVAIIGATVVWGILGALIIVPLMATAGVVGRYARCRLLHLEPWPEEADNSVDNSIVPHTETAAHDLMFTREPTPVSGNRSDGVSSAPIEPALVWGRHEPL